MQIGEGSRRGPEAEDKASRDHKDDSKTRQPIHQDLGARGSALVIQAGKLHRPWADSPRLEGLVREELAWPGTGVAQVQLPRGSCSQVGNCS